MTAYLRFNLPNNVFLLTRPLRDVTHLLSTLQPKIQISTHTPLAGRDTVTVLRIPAGMIFLLTRPLRDVTYTV